MLLDRVLFLFRHRRRGRWTFAHDQEAVWIAPVVGDVVAHPADGPGDVTDDERLRFDVAGVKQDSQSVLRPFEDEEIQRTLSPQCDMWSAGDLRFTIYSPVTSAPVK